MMLHAGSRLREAESMKSSARRRLPRCVVAESLEGRTLFSGLLNLALLPSPPGPSLGVDGGSASGVPLGGGNTEITVNSPNNFSANLGGSPTLIIPPAVVQIDVQVDSSGNLVGGNPHGGQDLLVFQDMNASGGFDAGDTLLLQGTVNAFGAGGLREEFAFTPTAGSWMPYFTVAAGIEQVGVQLDVILDDTTITSLDFANGFAGAAKGALGAVPPTQHGPLPVTISGTKYNDLTGLGFSPDDTPLGGVTINLYADNTSGGTVGSFDASDPLVSSTVTSNSPGTIGQYSFSVTTPGTYFVQEQTPPGYKETGPSAPYKIVVTAADVQTGNTYAKNDFDNYKIPYIKGKKYEDLTGNSFSTDDMPLGGVKILLYKDTKGDGVLTSADTLIASTTSAADGSFTFSGMPAGKYFVTEQLPSSKWLSTGPTNKPLFNGVPYYTVNVTAGSVSTGNNFDNFFEECDISNVRAFYYTINGGTTHYSTLQGSVHQGDQVTVFFDLKTTDTVTLVSYTSEHSTFVASDASKQVIFDQATGTFGPGLHSLTVTVPMCYFQIDFICGPAIDRFGPAGSNVFYRAEKRLFDAGQGGTDPCLDSGAKISGYVFDDKNKSNTKNSGDVGIAGALITLSGTDSLGHKVKLYRLTDANGFYYFKGLRAGTYSITETQPKGYTDGADLIGTINGLKKGNLLTNDSISSIVLALTSVGVNYDFAENKAT